MFRVAEMAYLKLPSTSVMLGEDPSKDFGIMKPRKKRLRQKARPKKNTPIDQVSGYVKQIQQARRDLRHGRHT